MRSSSFVMLAFVAISLLGSVVARAGSSQTAVMAPVRQFVDGINQNDLAKSVAACAPTAAIIDDIPPHEWQGPTACADWARGFQAGVKQAGWTDLVLMLGTPRHIDVDGDSAYVVAPASFTYRQNGKTGGESGSIWTFALRKLGAGWRIAGWSWAKH